MHGMGSNEQDLLPLVSGFEEQMFIFSIRGPIYQPPGYAFFSFKEFGNPDRESFDKTINILNQFFTYAEENYPIDANQYYLMGFSQGAILSMSLGVLFDDKIKGIIALSGYVPPFIRDEHKNKSLQNLNIYISHGVADEVLSFQWGKEASEFFTNTGAHVSFNSYQTGHWVSEENFTDLTQWLKNELA